MRWLLIGVRGLMIGVGWAITVPMLLLSLVVCLFLGYLAAIFVTVLVRQYGFGLPLFSPVAGFWDFVLIWGTRLLFCLVAFVVWYVRFERRPCLPPVTGHHPRLCPAGGPQGAGELPHQPRAADRP